MIKLSRSTYYYRKKEKQDVRADELLLKAIHKIIEEFPRYGYRRVTKQLHRDGTQVNHKRIYRLMKKHKLLCKQRRKFKVYTTDSNHDYPIYPNLVGGMTITRINQVWVADLTYIRIKTCFVYLAVILDAFSRKVIGYALSQRIDRALSLAALKMAISNRKPPEGCIHHSDRGVQYACYDYINELRDNKFQISMSQKGNPYDNAIAESFMKTLKYDEVYLSEYDTFDDVVENVFGFIEDVYNAKRLHSSIGYMPPNEFEQGLDGSSCQKKTG